MLRKITFILLTFVVYSTLIAQTPVKNTTISPPPPPKKKKIYRHVDYVGFYELTDSLREYRNTRLIDEKTFIKYSKNRKTIILDTRSKKAFDDFHLKGAIHINFSDFTDEKLAQIIPNKETRILIYCNNNFKGNRPSLRNKRAPLALNIPTFINLYGYGYQNIYELNASIKLEECKIPVVLSKKPY